MAVTLRNTGKVSVRILKRFVYKLEEVGPDTTKDSPVEMPLDDFRLYSKAGFVEEWVEEKASQKASVKK
ncbi:MAG TPA: hypothetical protein VHO03_03680 [Ignavibacteriales bacterium]|nr:hypothetical protein [Ignavibacteriales bacterium]